MERPKVTSEAKDRQVTPEIVYLNVMRKSGTFPKKFEELGEIPTDIYTNLAETYRELGVRPEIMDLYDEYDSRLSDTETGCIALADELLKLKDEESTLSFLDIAVDQPASEVLAQLQATKAGELLAADNEQLAIESNGEYYPVLDFKKENSELISVGVRVWGWDHEKYLFTNDDDETRLPSSDALMYPVDEKLAQRQLEISFAYRSNQPAKDDGSNYFTEHVSLTVDSNGGGYLSRDISAMAYAETGYEGHKGKQLDAVCDDDVAAFGDLIAQIVGDEPESIGMRQVRHLSQTLDRITNESVRTAAQELNDIIWPAQMLYYLSLRPNGSEKRLITLMLSEETAEQAITAIRVIIDQWQKNRHG